MASNYCLISIHPLFLAKCIYNVSFFIHFVCSIYLDHKRIPAPHGSPNLLHPVSHNSSAAPHGSSRDTNLAKTIDFVCWQVCFNPAGSLVLSASQDHTARLWDTDSAQCIQVLEGHSDDVFSCAFSYYGDTIITASKDNTCRIWRNSVTTESLE